MVCCYRLFCLREVQMTDSPPTRDAGPRKYDDFLCIYCYFGLYQIVTFTTHITFFIWQQKPSIYNFFPCILAILVTNVKRLTPLCRRSLSVWRTSDHLVNCWSSIGRSWLSLTGNTRTSCRCWRNTEAPQKIRCAVSALIL